MQGARIPQEVADSAPRSSILRLEGVSKAYGGQQVLHDLDLDLEDGAFLTLLGPSGCGKTTTLNLVAGFLRPDAGRLFLRGVLANNLPPQRRKLGMVFQSWALFPHMTVFENVAYGLTTASAPKGEIPGRVSAMLELVRLSGAGAKYPSQLSGGMQQRVALARALVTEPDLLLLDEPLSNLDVALRKEMQVELKRIHERLRVTTLLVTHSQEEALVMSDRIAVMRGGRIERIDTPAAIYNDPRTAFVCAFVGDANIFRATIEDAPWPTLALRLSDHRLMADRARAPSRSGSANFAVRPENIGIAPIGGSSEENVLDGTVSDTIFKGQNLTYEVEAAGTIVQVLALARPGERIFARGERVSLGFSRRAVILLDDDDDPHE